MRPSAKIVLLERAPKIGAKILISGGGRCNVTHDSVAPSDFNANQPIIRRILAAFDEHAVQRWFASLGVRLKREETGKLFPVTDRAATIVDALVRRCAELGVETFFNVCVSSILPTGDRFQIRAGDHTWNASRVVLATGGRSLPRTGSDGSGWQLARSLGHTVTATDPALVPLVLSPNFPHAALAGIALEVELSVFASGKRIDVRSGSLLFTHFGISGPVVLDASRHWARADRLKEDPEMRCRFLPGSTFESLDHELQAAARAHPRLEVQNWMARRLPARLAGILAEMVEVAGVSLGQLSRDRRRDLVHALVELRLPVIRARGWDFAEVTAGGVPLSEIDSRTMESRIQPGLFLAGEMLDCDGRIGGFNFQWAWSTGHLAGTAAARARR